MAYLGKTTWPISTVFRLWLENINWVANAETASGPTPTNAPDYESFLIGVQALQRMQDRKLIALFSEEREEQLTDGVANGPNTPSAAVEAVKAGFEYRRDNAGAWSVVRKRTQPLLRLGSISDNDPDWHAVTTSFKLNPTRRKFDLTTDKLDPFLAGAPPGGLVSLDLETRSLLQVLFFVAHGVNVPAEHVAAGIVTTTTEAHGATFDWHKVLAGLFRVEHADGKKPPPFAHVAVQYKGYWFYLDQRDRDSLATFNLLVELSRLELGAKAGSAPILTLPLGGR